MPGNPTKAGANNKKYTFAGWNTQDSGGDNSTAFNQDTTVTGDLSVYAQWQESDLDAVAVSFDPQGGVVSPIVRMVTPGGTVPLADIPAPTKTGYSFGGWKDGLDATFDQTYTVNTALTVYAQWTVLEYDITCLDADSTASGTAYSGTGGGPLPAKHIYGTPTALPEVTKDGYRFDGWYTESPAVNRVYSLDATGYDSNPPVPITVWAEWTRLYTVTYDQGSGGGTTPTQPAVRTGTTITLPGQGAMTNTGFTFGGWNEGSPGGDLYSAGAAYAVTADVTFHAKWTADAPGITGQPQSRDYGLSEPTVALSVTASVGTGGLSYQWYSSTDNFVASDDTIAGETTASYLPPPATAGSTAYYRVVVTNTATSAVATSATATVRYRTLKERVEDAAGKTATIALYQNETFAAVSAANITGNTRITLEGSGSERTVTLDISGGGYMFYVSGGASLSLGDNVTLQGAAGNNTTALVGVEGSSLAMSGSAKITGNKSTGMYGGGVYFTGSGGSFAMSGGAISGNSIADTGSANITRYGGGVYFNSTGGSFTMSSGDITDNETLGSGSYGTGSGGGVYFTSTGGSFTMSGGAVISKNTAGSGGGVVVASTGKFTMDGGTIGGRQ
jgi:uncharacterized repeat protein (TIGR02543 family)